VGSDCWHRVGAVNHDDDNDRSWPHFLEPIIGSQVQTNTQKHKEKILKMPMKFLLSLKRCIKLFITNLTKIKFLKM